MNIHGTSDTEKHAKTSIHIKVYSNEEQYAVETIVMHIHKYTQQHTYSDGFCKIRRC